MSTLALEQHYSVHQVAEMWSVSAKSVQRLFQDEPGVLKFRWPPSIRTVSLLTSNHQTLPEASVKRMYFSRKEVTRISTLNESHFDVLRQHEIVVPSERIGQQRRRRTRLWRSLPQND